MTLTTALPSAGWFPDPGDPAQERWWSGEAWTEHERRIPKSSATRPTLVPDAGDDDPSEYVFPMAESEPDEEPETPADHTVERPKSREAAAPARPTLPSFEELLAAVAAPPTGEPDDDIAAPEAAETWTPKSYGAPARADASAPAAPVAPAVLPSLPPVPGVPAASAVEPIQPAEAAVVAEPVEAAEPAAAEVPAEPAAAEVPAEPTTFAQPTEPPAVATAAALPTPNAMPVPALPGLPAPPVPLAPVAAAATPVGFTTSADPAIANRYRQALHTPEPEAAADADPFAAAMGPHPTPGTAAGGSPSQPGWQGMPLPAAGQGIAAFHGTPASQTDYHVPSAEAGNNKTAWTALGSGALSIGLAILFLMFDSIGLWPALLAFAAIIQGIIAAVHWRKVRTGLFPAIGAIVLGVIAAVIMVTTAVSWSANPEYYMPGRSMEIEIVASSDDLGVDLVSATCPETMSGVAGDSFTCTARDAQGTVYPVEVVLDADGYFTWTITA